MRHVLVIAVVGVAPSLGALAEDSEGPRTSSERRTCDTVYVGPPGGSLYNPLNWEPFLPKASTVACFPDDQRVGSVNPPDDGRLVSAGIEVRIIPSTGNQTGGSDDPPYEAGMYNPPAPTATGSCCLGSTCVQTDAFDCRELGGYFLEGVGPCTEFVCATGACCKQDAACVDDDGGGGPMDEDLCGTMSGDYLGGALCDNDPCQRFRIPDGFEIVEVAPGTEMLKRRHPRINNCGQIVFHMASEPGASSTGPTSEIHLYDNGTLTQITDNDISDTFPDINDAGTIVWMRGFDGSYGGEIVMLRGG